MATLRTDGSPRIARVWYVEHAGALWVASAESNLKVADVRRDPRIALAVEGRHGGFRGSATIEAIDSAPEVLREFARRYAGWDASSIEPDGPRVLIRLPIV
jgi:hypothetical protein